MSVDPYYGPDDFDAEPYKIFVFAYYALCIQRSLDSVVSFFGTTKNSVPLDIGVIAMNFLLYARQLSVFLVLCGFLTWFTGHFLNNSEYLLERLIPLLRIRALTAKGFSEVITLLESRSYLGQRDEKDVTTHKGVVLLTDAETLQLAGLRTKKHPSKTDRENRRELEKRDNTVKYLYGLEKRTRLNRRESFTLYSGFISVIASLSFLYLLASLIGPPTRLQILVIVCVLIIDGLQRAVIFPDHTRAHSGTNTHPDHLVWQSTPIGQLVISFIMVAIGIGIILRTPLSELSSLRPSATDERLFSFGYAALGFFLAVFIPYGLGKVGLRRSVVEMLEGITIGSSY